MQTRRLRVNNRGDNTWLLVRRGPSEPLWIMEPEQALESGPSGQGFDGPISEYFKILRCWKQALNFGPDVCKRALNFYKSFNRPELMHNLFHKLCWINNTEYLD